MIDQLNSILRDECGLSPSRPVLAGISGGPDSLCLLDVLRQAGYPVVVAHFNHRLRPEADREAADVSTLADKIGFPFEGDSADVQAYAEAQKLSLEEAARMLRYRFLFAAARRHKAQAVAVGHTADDQVETVLMHFLRGAGLSGLKGMEFRTTLPAFDDEIPIVRPLLGLWRSDTESYCREHGLQPHIDATNYDQAYFRNRLRHTLIPELEGYHPHFKESLLRTARALQGDYAVLQEVLDNAWDLVFNEKGEGWVAFDRAGLGKLSAGLRRNLIRRAAESLRPESRDIGFEALQRADAFVEAPAGTQVDFVNGLYLFNEEERVILAAYEADLPTGNWPQVSRTLSLELPGKLDLGNGWQMSACELAADGTLAQVRENADPYQAWLDAGALFSALVDGANRLAVRAAPAGERFQPLGMDGHSLKLSDFFVNIKIPRRARKNWPVVYARDVPVWVAGCRIAHPYRVTEETERVVRLSLKKIRADA